MSSRSVILACATASPETACAHRAETCAWMQVIVEDPLMRHSAVLVFANKQDLVRHTINS